MIDYKNLNKKTPKQNRNWLKIISIIVIFSFLLSVFTASAYFYTVYTKKHYILRYVAISGNKILNTKLIKNFTHTNRTKSMYEYNEKSIYSKLMLNPWIKKAYVAKLYPDTIYIKVVEKTPKAAVTFENKTFIVDSNGNKIDQYKSGLNISLNKLPKIIAHSSNDIKSSLIKSVIKMYEKLDKFDKINYIEIMSGSYQLVHFTNSLNIVVDSLDCPNEAFGHLKKEWNNLVSKKSRLDSVSICFSNKFVLRWKKEKKGGGK